MAPLIFPFTSRVILFLFRTAKCSIQGINSFLIHSTRDNESNTTFETSVKGATLQETEILNLLAFKGGRGSTVVKVLCYKSEGRWFDPSLSVDFSLT